MFTGSVSLDTIKKVDVKGNSRKSFEYKIGDGMIRDRLSEGREGTGVTWRIDFPKMN